MKTTFTFFFFTIFTMICTAQWEELSLGVDVDYFNDVHTISQSAAVVVGSEGTILKTNDGGDTWTQKESGTNEVLSNVQFASAQIGFITGANGTFLKTMNGGETWNSIDGVCGGELSCVNENLIFVNCGSNLYKSENGGEDWIIIPGMPDAKKIQFLNAEIGFSGNYFWENDYENPQIYKTIDGGMTWESISGVAPFYFLNEHVGFYYLGGLHKTIDGGNSFEQLTFDNNEEFSLSDIYAIDENTIWGLVYLSLLDWDTSSRGVIKISSTNSENFEEVILPDNNPEFHLESIHFADETIGFTVGRRGNWPNTYDVMWRNGNGINEPMNIEEQEMHHFQVYPNPATSELNVIIENSSNKTCQVEISDLSGKSVFFKEYLNQNTFKIDVKSFPIGTYILKVNNQSQKIIIK